MDTTEICNTDDVINSHEIIYRLEELKSEALDGPLEAHEYTELQRLQELADECEDADDWEYGVTLIRGTYFEDYARELAWEIGAINADHEWPLNCIDWEQAARELQMDYTPVDYGLVTYWYR